MYNADIEKYLNSVNHRQNYAKRLRTFIPVLSIFVILIIFWCLKLTGITLAGEAFCGFDEHEHNEECIEKVLICEEVDRAEEDGEITVNGVESSEDSHQHTDECYRISETCEIPEHIHTADCYSDISADLETAEIWEETIKGIPPEMSGENTLIAVAESQLGYQESELNFTVDEENEKHGYTRYGEWYGNPYGEWSTMFTSFCLHYAGIDDIEPSAGAESMQMELQENEMYEPAGEYVPYAGNIVFLDKDGDAAADATAVITEVTGASISVIEGDLDNKVSDNSYELTEKSVLGYGVLSVQETAALAVSEESDTEDVSEESAQEQADGSDDEDNSTTEPEDEKTETDEDTGKDAVRKSTFAMSRAVQGQTYIGQKVGYYADLVNSNAEFVIYTQGTDGNYYAIDGNGYAVQVYVDNAGNVTTNSTNPDSLLWRFSWAESYDWQSTHYIQNVATGRYIHPFYNDAYNSGTVLTDKWETAVYYYSDGIKLRGARQNAYSLLTNNSFFNVSNDLNTGSVFYIARAPERAIIWLDGTNGNLRSLAGSPDQRYSASMGGTFTLPEQWQSPTKYAFKLRGWYDVTNNKYYQPGETVTVTGNMVFYADWEAESYDVGQFNQYVADTVSTDDFVTTKVFDYNYLFNVMSQYASVNISESDHSETWSFVSNGNVPYQNSETLNFVFTDYHPNNNISNSDNRNAANIYDEANPVITGIYNDKLGDMLFGTDNELIGKEYLGTGDHLFQIDDDPASDHYGYYYYDCSLNAASYNQTDQRFYVYDYLERTADSEGAATGTYSDILPFNSPYVNTNGQGVDIYTYDGVNGEYVGTNHCQYDIASDDTARAGANMAFGLSIDINFYLPNTPGSTDADGEYGNRDIYGNEMHFKFSGDDDLWVLIDGKVALDIGGIHTEQSGDINFSTGAVTVNGSLQRMITDLEPGEHTLTILYLERGSSMSNCALYFNLAPRFELEIQKEDAVTQELLDGAQFSVYTDEKCTVPATLWCSQSDYKNGEPSTNTFTVKDGSTNIWGFGAGNTYYIKETRAPDASGYGLSSGIIKVVFDKTGMASDSIQVMEEVDSNGNKIPVTEGYTVHGFRIDEESQKAYISVTNAQEWVEETTAVQVTKKWNDTENHQYDSVTAYLTITDPDGTVRRIREITLSEENNWSYTWTNLPKYREDQVTEIVYGVEESYSEGYSPSIKKLDSMIDTENVWTEMSGFEDGKKYILKTSAGCLASASATSNSVLWVSEADAKGSELAQWTTSVSGSNVIFTNGAGQILRFNQRDNGSFFDVNTTVYNKNMEVSVSDNNIRIAFNSNGQLQYASWNMSNQVLYTTTEYWGAVTFTPMTLIPKETVQDVEGTGYEITNTPLEEETSLKVTKKWDLGMVTNADYEKAQVTVKLLTNGKDTGRTVTLSLKNNWTGTFKGLPYRDENGDVIEYTVEESWQNEDWEPVYGEIITVGGTIPTYETTVTNNYIFGHGYILPETGGPGLVILLLCELVTMTGVLVCGCMLRRKREGGYG